MIDPRQIASQLLGAIDWQSEVSGFCKCPGSATHTCKSGKTACRVNIDGVPTIHCFHASCSAAVAEANRRLRRLLGFGASWALSLPGGRVLRSGDLLQPDGTVLRREVVKASAQAQAARSQELAILQSIRAHAARFLPDLLDFFRWPLADMLQDSALHVSEREPDQQFRLWLKLWPACSTLWIGKVFDSGKPEHRTHFRPVADWYRIGPVMGNFTCGSSFQPGSYRRSNETIDCRRFMVVESDTLAKDQVGAVFRYLQQRLGYTLHCVVDTAGKSLHGWFDTPKNKIWETRLKAGLQVFGCDPQLFTYSQPVRVPGAWRDGKLQKLIWLRDS